MLTYCNDILIIYLFVSYYTNRHERTLGAVLEWDEIVECIVVPLLEENELDLTNKPNVFLITNTTYLLAFINLDEETGTPYKNYKAGLVNQSTGFMTSLETAWEAFPYHIQHKFSFHLDLFDWKN